MDDPPTSSSSPPSTMAESSQSSSSLAATASTSYESIMKRLLKIIRNHRVVNDFKPLEDLWELCNTPPPPTTQAQLKTQPPPSSESSDTQTKSSLKRDSSKLPIATGENKEKESKKLRLSANTSSSNSVNKLKSNSNSPPSKAENDTNNQTSTKNTPVSQQKNNVIPLQEQPQSIPVPIDSLNNDLSDFNSMVVDMLDFSCFICKRFNQEPNNKLIECRQCTQLYHQKCHEPVIDKDQIESSSKDQVESVGDGESRQMVWYLPRCMNCTIQKSDNDSLSHPPNSLAISKSPTHSAIQSRSPENPVQPVINNNSQPIAVNNNMNGDLFKNNKEKITAAATNPVEQSTNSLLGKQQVKGLAALATKLNTTNGTTSSLKSSPNTLSPSSKANHDDLFKKFRQTVNNNTSLPTSTPTPVNSTPGLDLKRKFLASTQSQATQPPTQQAQLNKKPLFNLGSSQANTIKSPNSTTTNTNIIVNTIVKK